MSSNNFSSEDFLDDVKHQIKIKFKNQSNYANYLHIGRKTLNAILNSGDELEVGMMIRFADDLGLLIRNYLPRG